MQRHLYNTPVNHDGICVLADNHSSSDEDLIVKCKMSKVDILEIDSDQQSIASVVSESTALPKCVKLVKKSENPLPDPFPLPSNFRYDVEVALKNGEMTRETTRSFFSSVAGSMFSYKRYPTNEEYTRVAMTIIQEYPFLKDGKSDSPIVSYTCIFPSSFYKGWLELIINFKIDNSSTCTHLKYAINFILILFLTNM